MVTIFGRRLIEYVALALEDSSVEKIYVATTENVPLTGPGHGIGAYPWWILRGWALSRT